MRKNRKKLIRRKPKKETKKKSVQKGNEKDTLSPKQLRFCFEYVKDFNAQRSARDAGYSSKTAGVQGSRLLTYDKVKKKLSELEGKKLEKLDIKSDDILKELQIIAFANKKEFKKWPMKMTDKLKALELLGKHLTLFSDKVTIDGSITCIIVDEEEE